MADDKNSDINYFKIGAFVLFGISLILAAFLIFGSSRLFLRTVYIETYFDESVQGISEGAPVKYRGLQIGYVKEMAFTSEKYKNYQESNNKIRSRSIYVKVAITSKLFTQLSDDELSKLLNNEVIAGLRVKLLAQGLTGISYLDLNYVNPQENPIPQISWQPENFYMPSAPGVLTQLADNVQYILQDMRQVNFKELADNFSRLIAAVDKTANKMSVTLDQLSKLQGSAKATLYSVEDSANNLKALSEQIKLYPSQLLFSGAPPRINPNKL